MHSLSKALSSKQLGDHRWNGGWLFYTPKWRVPYAHQHLVTIYPTNHPKHFLRVPLRFFFPIFLCKVSHKERERNKVLLISSPNCNVMLLLIIKRVKITLTNLKGLKNCWSWLMSSFIYITIHHPIQVGWSNYLARQRA